MHTQDKLTPSTRVEVTVGSGARAEFEQWRWGISPLFDLEIPRDVTPPDYSMSTSGQFLTDITVTRTRSSPSLFLRSPRVIARAGLDNITAMVYTAGRLRFTTGRTEGEIGTGDILLFDLTRPITIEAGAYENLSVSLSRALIEPLLTRIDRLHGLVVPTGSPLHGLLLSYMTQLWNQFGPLTTSASDRLAEATAQLVAAAAESTSGAPALVASHASLLQRIRAEIEAQIGNPELGPEWLAAKFSVSRATLYRLFGEYGGVHQHIQARRLLQAYRALARGGKDQRIGSIAARVGFSDQAAFSRAFRAVYGLSPREVAQIANNPEMPPLNTALGFVEINRWMAGSKPVGSELAV